MWKANTAMFDEMIDPDSDGARQPYASLFEWLNEQNFSKLCNQSKQAEELFRRIGITFNSSSVSRNTIKIYMGYWKI